MVLNNFNMYRSGSLLLPLFKAQPSNFEPHFFHIHSLSQVRSFSVSRRIRPCELLVSRLRNDRIKNRERTNMVSPILARSISTKPELSSTKSSPPPPAFQNELMGDLPEFNALKEVLQDIDKDVPNNAKERKIAGQSTSNDTKKTFQSKHVVKIKNIDDSGSPDIRKEEKTPVSKQESDIVQASKSHPFEPREIKLRYQNMKHYSRRMATLLYLEEMSTLEKGQSLQFTTEDFTYRRYTDPEMMPKGLIVDLKISPVLKTRFFKLAETAKEDQTSDSQDPDLGGQGVFVTLNGNKLWAGYVTSLPKNERLKQKAEGRSTNTLTVAIKFYKWGFEPLPKNLHQENLKIMFVSTQVNHMLRAISRVPISSFPMLVLGKSDIGYNRSKPSVELSEAKFNESQNIAVRSVLQRQITVVQGPPGTGKTSTIHEMILQLLEKDIFPIVVVAASNVAVDNIAEKMVETHGDLLLRLTSLGKEAEYMGDHHLASICLHNKFYNASSPELQRLLQRLRSEPQSLTPQDFKSIQRSKRKFLVKQLSTQKVIFTTNTAAAGLMVGNPRKFPVIIMDEATQSSEPASLIPLTLPGVKKIVLVGDQKQLSCTTNVKGLSLSLFERVIRNGTFKSHQLLDTQYRMHPAISGFSRKHIYSSQLRDGVTAQERRLSGLPKNPVLFWDTGGRAPEKTIYLSQGDVEEIHCTKSNPKEARMVERILQHLIEKKGIKRSSIGVITPYRGQRNEICSVLMQNKIINPKNEEARVEIDEDEFSSVSEKSTVQYVSGIMLASIDAFQGREKDFIIMSCVRSNAENDIGFLTNKRRLNVALTRAKYGLILVGDLKCLSNSSKIWKSYESFLEEAGSVHRGLYIKYG